MDNTLNNTRLERLNIGFKDVRRNWMHAPAEFTNDTLRICNHPVMERWEDAYMKQLAAIATQNGGTVLEVGFGMGISAKYIQTKNIEKHIIIEANAAVFEKAGDFAKTASKLVEPLFGFWEDVTHRLPPGSISGILFDTYPLTEEEIHCNHFPFFKEAFRLLKPGGILTYYSDEIHDFSDGHREHLRDAGFTNIQGIPCKVVPPKNCQYWRSKTILAPIITK